MKNSDELERLHRDLVTLRTTTTRDQAVIAALREQLRDYRRETQHRVRNLLSIVRSVARRSMAEGETAEEYQIRLDSRLAAIARTQGYVLRRFDGSVDLAELIVGELSAFDVAEGIGAHVEGRMIWLKPVAAAVLGLAFQELARLTIEGDRAARGSTTARWWIDSVAGMPDALNIEWRDTGRGLNAAALARSAFAYDVLDHAIPYQLKGEAWLTEIDDGIACTVRVPITCVASL